MDEALPSGVNTPAVRRGTAPANPSVEVNHPAKSCIIINCLHQVNGFHKRPDAGNFFFAVRRLLKNPKQYNILNPLLTKRAVLEEYSDNLGRCDDISERGICRILWKGPCNLHDMLDIPSILSHYKYKAADNCLNLPEIHSMEDLEQYLGLLNIRKTGMYCGIQERLVEPRMKEMISAVTHVLRKPAHSRPLRRMVILGMIIAAMSASTSYAGQWQQDESRWWYENDDRTFPAGAWKWIDGKYYYFDENGYMMSDRSTPDGYQVGADGAFVPGPGQSVNQVGGIRCGDEDAVIHMWMNNDGTPVYQNEIHYGLECYVIEPGVDSFLFPSEGSNLNPDAHEVWLYGVTMVNGNGVILEGINMMPFEYDKVYSFDFTGNYDTAGMLAQHCIDNDVTITVHLVDRTKYSIRTGYPASAWRYRYATPSSTALHK